MSNVYEPKNSSTPGGNDAAHFAKDSESAFEYTQHGPYEDYIIEVQVSKPEYDDAFSSLEQPLPGRPGKTEVPVPHDKSPILSDSPRIKHERP